MITQRRVFQGKVGQAAAIVGKIKEIQRMLAGQGWPAGRIYTDLFSGQTDRVAWELDMESLAAMDTAFQMTGLDTATQQAFGKWFSELTPLIEGAAVELWTRQDV